MTSTHRLDVSPLVSAPGKPLLLRAKLPLGGTITIFTSGLLAADHCVFDFFVFEYFDRLQLRRLDNGKLFFAEGAPRAARRNDKWTFRL